MRSVGTTTARAFGAALLLTILTTPLYIDTRSKVRGADKAPAKALPAELAKAIRDGDLKAVRAQLDTGLDVNARDADGNTPLLLAAVYAGPECVEWLLKKGADVNAANKLGVTPLHRAATNYEKAKLLVDAGANVEVKTRAGRTPLTLAARKYGNSKTVKLLLDKGTDAKERNDLAATREGLPQSVGSPSRRSSPSARAWRSSVHFDAFLCRSRATASVWSEPISRKASYVAASSRTTRSACSIRAMASCQGASSSSTASALAVSSNEGDPPSGPGCSCSLTSPSCCRSWMSPNTPSL